MKKRIKLLILPLLALVLTLSLPLCACAAQSEEAEEAADGFFPQMFGYAEEYATEIICTLTLIGSLLLGYAYRKGLLPLVKGALSAIGSSVGSIKEGTDAGNRQGAELCAMLTDRLNLMETLIGEAAAKTDALTEGLSEVKSVSDRKESEMEALAVIMTAQIDMLYDIFMTSALPQYQKDKVGERVAEMKEALDAARQDG